MFNTVFLLSLSAVLTVPSSLCLSVSGGIAVKGFYHDADSNPIGLDSSGYATSDWVNQVFARVVNTLTTQINHNLDSSNSNSVLPSGSVFTEKLCIQSFLKMCLCFGSAQYKLSHQNYPLDEKYVNHNFLIEKLSI